jgi:heme-degrading monooxygenase HmoA|tara:strand:+ start:65 stop:373 length:309 start_codon:yes stop_codon:yes gene_type:complete
MYLAFSVLRDNAADFEDLWLGRESRLKDTEGFISFHMLKGPEEEGQVLYASHTVWESEAHFRAWTTSDAFRAAHARAGETRKLHEGSPRFEGFRAIQKIEAS